MGDFYPLFLGPDLKLALVGIVGRYRGAEGNSDKKHLLRPTVGAGEGRGAVVPWELATSPPDHSY